MNKNKQQEESKDNQETLNFVKNQKLLSTDYKASRRLRRNPHSAVEITAAAGFSRLNENEKDLIIKLQMMPDTYNQIKKALIQENEKNKAVKESYIEDVSQEVGNGVNPQQSIGKRSVIYLIVIFTVSQTHLNISIFVLHIYNEFNDLFLNLNSKFLLLLTLLFYLSRSKK